MLWHSEPNTHRGQAHAATPRRASGGRHRPGRATNGRERNVCRAGRQCEESPQIHRVTASAASAETVPSTMLPGSIALPQRLQSLLRAKTTWRPAWIQQLRKPTARAGWGVNDANDDALGAIEDCK